MINPKIILHLLALIFLGWPVMSVHALPKDRQQPITIHSDKAERDEIKGTTTYSGNVIMQQGTLRIEAQEVTIFNTKNKVTQIVATGQPAKYQQQITDTQGPVIAEANRLDYRITDNTLRMVENAALQHDGTRLTGETIEFDVKKSVVKAGGESRNSRVKMIIPPTSIQQNEQDDSDAEASE